VRWLRYASPSICVAANLECDRRFHFFTGLSRQQAGRAGVKPGAITRRHGLERVLARGTTIAAHLIGAAADREHSAYRAVATAEQEVKCASDESFHFSEFKKLFLNSSWVGFGAEIRDGVGEGWKRQG